MKAKASKPRAPRVASAAIITRYNREAARVTKVTGTPANLKALTPAALKRLGVSYGKARRLVEWAATPDSARYYAAPRAVKAARVYRDREAGLGFYAIWARVLAPEGTVNKLYDEGKAAATARKPRARKAPAPAPVITAAA